MADSRSHEAILWQDERVFPPRMLRGFSFTEFYRLTRRRVIRLRSSSFPKAVLVESIDLAEINGVILRIPWYTRLLPGRIGHLWIESQDKVMILRFVPNVAKVSRQVVSESQAR